MKRFLMVMLLILPISKAAYGEVGVFDGLLPEYTPFTFKDHPFYDESGKERSLSEFKEKPLLVNFWAVWCPPCRDEMTLLNQLQGEGLEFDIIVISIDTNVDKAKAFLKKFPNLTFYHDPKSAFFLANKGRGLPVSLFFDKNLKPMGRVDGVIEDMR